jgi:hypothetical protein
MKHCALGIQIYKDVLKKKTLPVDFADSQLGILAVHIQNMWVYRWKKGPYLD